MKIHETDSAKPEWAELKAAFSKVNKVGDLIELASHRPISL